MVSKQEQMILDMTAKIWNTFIEMEQTHPSDIDDLHSAIHDIQKIIAVRVVRKVEPDVFVTIKEDK